MTEQEEYEQIVANEPPTRGPFIERSKRQYLGSNGIKYSVMESITFSGVPELVTLVEDLHDSFWRYPEIKRQLVGFPTNVSEAESQAEFWKAKRS